MHPTNRLPEQRMHRVVVQVLGRFLGFVPKALGLPRVEGKFEKSRRLSRVERRPRNRVAVAVQCPDAMHERTAVVLIASLSRQDDGVALMGSGYLEERCGENRVWTQFHKVGISIIEHPADGRFEKTVARVFCHQ